MRFRPAPELTPEAVAAIAEQVRVRVLRWFARTGLIEAEDVRERLAWENSGFSFDAALRVATHDRAGLGGHAHHRFPDRGRARRADSLGSRRAHGSAADCPRAPRRCTFLLRLGISPNHPGLVVRCFSAAHPYAWDDGLGPMPDWDLLGQPEPDVEFDQRVSW